MLNTINDAVKLHTELIKSAKIVRKRLRRRVPGRLTISNSARGILYFQDYKFGTKRKTKGIGKNMDLVYRLAHQAYNEELLTRIVRNEKVMAKLVKELVPIDEESILKALPKNYGFLNQTWIVKPEARLNSGLITPISDGSLSPAFIYTHVKEDRIPTWQSEPYCANNAFPERKKHTTSAGFSVRSKSEASLFELYCGKNYPFHYDELLWFSDYLKSPDFLVMRPDGTLFIHEHLGRMDLEEYRDNFYEKLMIYRKHGFELGRNLLLTFDDEYGNINLQLISSLIDDMYNR